MAIDNVVGFEHCPLNCSFLKVVIFKDPQHVEWQTRGKQTKLDRHGYTSRIPKNNQ